MENIAEWIKNLSSSSAAIIVEGKNDEKALRSIGAENTIIKLSKKPLFKIAEDTAKMHDRVVILTDLDKKGKQYYIVLKNDLQRLGVEIDNIFREWLIRNTKISHIEGICADTRTRTALCRKK